MKRNKITLAAASGLVGLSVLAGSMALASGNSDENQAQELQQFLMANPEIATVVADVEARNGGKVTGAEFDDEAPGNGIVEFEILTADGSEQDVQVTLADGSMIVGALDQDDHEDDGDDEGDDDDGDDDGESNDDN